MRVCLILITLITVLAGCGRSGTHNSTGPSGCHDNEYSSGIERIGVLRSIDGGESWDFLGDACFHAPSLIPVDPSPIAEEEGLALYFLDLLTLNRPDSDSVIYRAETQNGLEFSDPVVALTYPDDITDPYVLRMANGTYKMFTANPTDPASIFSASSGSGSEFSINGNTNLILGGTPGALLLPDNSIRLFVADPDGITSYISHDGITYEKEPGIRIEVDGTGVTDPHPVRLSDGRYLMVYVVHPQGQYASEQARLASLEMHLAWSSDSFNWDAETEMVRHGSVPGLVEAADGTLYIFYVDVIYE